MRVYGKRASGSKFRWPELSLVVGACLWGVVWYPMRWLQSRGLMGLVLTLTLYVSALLVSLPATWRAFREWPGRVHVLLPLALLAGWTNIAFVLAILHGNIVRIMLLFYLSPAWTLILARIFLGELIHARALWTLVLSLCGATILLWPSAPGAVSFSGSDLLGLSAGMAFSASNIMTRALSGVSLAAKSTCVWMGVSVLSLSLILSQQLPWPALGAPIWIAAVALGGLGILTMTWLIQFGVTRLPAQRSSVLMLTELLAGALSQQWLTNETLSEISWIGGGLIAVAAWLAA